jgi:SAM-dependent methyltransferase
MRRLRQIATSILYRLRGKLAFEMPFYRESELARLANLFAHVDLESWQGMKVLEVGAGLGNLGAAFEHLGFDVTFSEGRPEYVERMRRQGRNAMVLDLNQTEIAEAGDFDIVLAFGVLYHLSRPERLFKGCARVKVMLMESVVCDAAESVVHRVREQSGWRGHDQALDAQACRPSPAWVEEQASAAGFDLVRDISSPLANWITGCYDWQPQGRGEWRRDGVNLRKMWVLERSSNQSS